MPTVVSPDLGEIEYRTEDLYRFPLGIPAFEHRRTFLLVENASYDPLLFLQSVEDAALRFVCAPINLFTPDCTLELSDEETEALALTAGEASQLQLLSIVSFPEQGTPTINLLAPLVLNQLTRRGVQSVQSGPTRDIRHPLRGDGEKQP